MVPLQELFLCVGCKRQSIYGPRIPFFRLALGGLGPSQTEKSMSAKFAPGMVSISLPAIASAVPAAGMYGATPHPASETGKPLLFRRRKFGVVDH